MITWSNTERGFRLGKFLDRYKEECSIQKSSLATENAIWLGISDPKPKVMVLGAGWKEVPLPDDAFIAGRMHLTQDQVRTLLPVLQHFAETGRLP